LRVPVEGRGGVGLTWLALTDESHE